MNMKVKLILKGLMWSAIALLFIVPSVILFTRGDLTGIPTFIIGLLIAFIGAYPNLDDAFRYSTEELVKSKQFNEEWKKAKEENRNSPNQAEKAKVLYNSRERIIEKAKMLMSSENLIDLIKNTVNLCKLMKQLILQH